MLHFLYKGQLNIVSLSIFLPGASGSSFVKSVFTLNGYWSREIKTMKIVIIGGSGLIGSRVVKKLGEQGHEAIAASPKSGVNAITGEGLAEVLKNAKVVVDVSNVPSTAYADFKAVMEFFKTSTGNLLKYEAVAGVVHHVVLSIVGSSENGYKRAKVAQENLIKESSVPYTIVRATQFFEFVGGIADEATKGKQVRLAPVLFQPIAADDVASVLSRAALDPALNGTVEAAGPEVFRLDEFMRQNLKASNDPREVVTDPHARYFGEELSERTLVPGEGARLGETRFAEWLKHSTFRAHA